MSDQLAPRMFYDSDEETYYLDRRERVWIVRVDVPGPYMAFPGSHLDIGIDTLRFDESVVEIRDATERVLRPFGGDVKTWADLAAVLDHWADDDVFWTDVARRVVLYDARSVETVTGSRLVIHKGRTSIMGEVVDDDGCDALDLEIALQNAGIECQVKREVVTTLVIEPIGDGPSDDPGAMIWIPRIVEEKSTNIKISS